MAEILSQQEIDELIRALAQESAAPAPSPAAGRQPTAEAPSASKSVRSAPVDRRVRVYDFRRPDKFSKDQLRVLSMIHDNFARLLATFFSASFRTVVQLSVNSVDQLTYEEFTQRRSNPSVMAVFSLPPLKGNAVLEIQPAIAFPMIDRIFGGPGVQPDRVRALTEIETAVMQRVVVGFLDSLKEAWRAISPLEPRLEGIESNPLFAQVVPGNEIVVSVEIGTRLGEHRGLMTLCLPFIVIEPLLSRLSAHHWFSATARDLAGQGSEELAGRVRGAPVELRAELGTSQLTVSELLGLEAGDVITLDQRVGQPGRLFVGERPKFTCLPGRSGKHMAVRVVSFWRDGEDEDHG